MNRRVVDMDLVPRILGWERNTSIWVFIILLATLTSCNQQNQTASESDSARSDAFQGFEHEVEIFHARNFSVSYHGDWKLVDLRFRSNVKEMDFAQKLVLVQRGSQPDLPDSLSDAWKMEVPVRSVAANDDGEITRLKNIELIDAIAGMGGGDIYDTELRQRWEKEQIASIGYSFHSIPAPELLMSSGAELLILHTYDNSRLEGMEKLRELGINAVPQFAWAEPNFLAKAEWVKFSALFFNKEKEANALFDRILRRCEDLMAKVEANPNQVKTFLLYHPSDNADWKAHRNDFYASYLQVISTNVLKDDGPTHSVGMNNETLLQLAKDADFWLVNNTEDTDWPPSSYLNSFKAYREGNVYHYQKRTRHEHNAYDWYETPVVRPDLVLEDLVAIFYPELLPGHELMFLEKVKLTKK